MEVVSLRPEHIDALYEIYVSQVERAPHCRFAPDRTRFRDDLLGNSASLPDRSGVQQATSSLLADFFDPPQLSHTFVAEEKGIAQGFATWASYFSKNDQVERQFIAGLFFASEQAGEVLIRACEERATTNEFFAFPSAHGNTPMHTYNAAWDGLSDRVPHVARVLVNQGYSPNVRELHLIAPLPIDQRQAGTLPVEIAMTVPEYPVGFQGERVIESWDGEREVGICTYSTLAMLTNDEDAARVGYIWWLHVHEAYRRRAIGRAMISAAMDQLAREGCTACWLTTAATNWNAQALYYSLGFDVVDVSTSFRKELRA